ncbi:putative F-box protein At1g49610 [Aristolochia californica]|uniref:putative F-box protein At1g49610 n=1 Tax=Aristolochia californica TaxID=171875 RepID=UPI0035E1188F
MNFFWLNQPVEKFRNRIGTMSYTFLVLCSTTTQATATKMAADGRFLKAGFFEMRNLSPEQTLTPCRISVVNGSHNKDGCRSAHFTDLPDHLILHVLSFLSITDAIKLSAVSRKFRFSWNFLSNLDFDQRAFPGPNNPRLYADFVDGSLILFAAATLNSFHLWFDYEHLYSSHVDSWVLFAVRKNVETLQLRLSGYRRSYGIHEGNPYHFPLALVSHGRLGVLNLCYCSLDSTPQLSFPHLKSIFLNDVKMSDEAIPDLVSGCPLLEELSVDYCYTVQHLKIVSPRLKKLELMHYQRSNSSVEISAPNLVTFSCLHYVAEKYEFRDLGSLLHAIVYFMDTEELLPRWRIVLGFLKHAKNIQLLNWWNPDLAQDRSKEINMLLNAHCLELKTGNTKMEIFGIVDFLRIAPDVTTLILDIINTEAVNKKEDNDVSDHDVFGVNFPLRLLDCNKNNLQRSYGERCGEELRGCLRNLKIVIVRWFVGSENELELLKYLLRHGVVLEKISLLSAKPRLQFGTEQLSSETLRSLQDFGRSFPNVEISLA